MILESQMLIYLTIDDPYNLNHVSAFSTQALADEYVKNNGGEVEVLTVDQYQGCREYRLYKIEYDLISGKQVTQNWDDFRLTQPPEIPAPRTYTPAASHVITIGQGRIIDQGFQPNLTRCQGWGLTYESAKLAAQGVRNQSLPLGTQG